MQSSPKAFLFDLNGTMIDDMQFHIRAWHRIVKEIGANLTLEDVKRECYGKNHDLLDRVFPNRFTIEEKNRMSIEKEKQYQQEFRPHLKLLNGLANYLEGTKDRNIKMAIGSAAIMFNIDFVLDGLNIRHYIDAIVSADDVEYSKPHPETFLKCADHLGIALNNCIVFEDAPKGVEAAANAGMRCAVLTTMHPQEDFAAYDNIIAFAKDFSDRSFLNLLEN
jgi:beta-phosphoglucomutase family hydrolase